MKLHVESKIEMKESRTESTVQLLAKKDEILAALEKGWTIRGIYERLAAEGSLHVTYDQMLRFVKKLGKVEFLEKKGEILAELNKGWPLDAVYDRLRNKGAIHFTYGQMQIYIREFIPGGVQGKAVATSEMNTKGANELPEAGPERKKPRIGKIETEPFKYNPNADISGFLGRKDPKPDNE